jgi:hypothetical protein
MKESKLKKSPKLTIPSRNDYGINGEEETIGILNFEDRHFTSIVITQQKITIKALERN